MKNFKNRKSILERGGLMIEALAMLGLIAVVTPTMYKKSAERTMEVEDINTSTTIRTLMNAAESYVAANYVQLLNDEDLKLPEDETQEQVSYKTVELSELSPYLPYKYETENSLYNYGKPKLSLVRSGDSISAFMLFPAKGDEAEGIGQERTVRIASLIGSNGGYVSDPGKEAHGVGGVWSLDETHYKDIFKDDTSNKYSIVTASTNVSNGGTSGGEPDMTKYLQRTRENNAGDGKELWRNSMRTDLYMGLVNNADDSWTAGNKKLYSIQNINKLIVGGHDTANKYNEDELKIADVDDSYGLYIAGSGADAKGKNGKGIGNAFVNGSIEALSTGNSPATALFKVKFNEIDAKTNGHLTFDGTHFELGKVGDTETYAIQANTEGNVNTMNIYDTTVAIDAGTADARKIDILGASGDKTIQIHEAKDAGTFGGKKAMVAINTGDEKKIGTQSIDAPKYKNESPDFGVDVDGNMVVQGVLAAGQLDVNKIRAAKLSVGSKNIDDEKKWMDVDENGIVIENPGTDSGAASNTGTRVHIDDKGVYMAYSGGIETESNNGTSSYYDHQSQLRLNEREATLSTLDGSGKTKVLAQDIGIEMQNDKMQIGGYTQASYGTEGFNKESYHVEFQDNGSVDIQKGNLKISDGDNPVFTVYGNKENNMGLVDDMKSQPGTGEDAVDYQIAGHGNAVFTDVGDNTRYLAMGPEDTASAVNIVRGKDGHGGKTNDSSTQLLYIDLDERNAESYTSAPGQGSTNYQTQGKEGHLPRNIRGGTIYIRKGLIDIAPNKDDNASGGEIRTFNADNGNGVIRASRFVANNVTYDGERVMVPDMFKDNFKNSAGGTSSKSVYEVFNGTEGANRYDTYMVNPAYTSVMNDIKLVSRSGARLSDILPDFITKAIYTATNTWTEDMFDGISERDPSKYTLDCDGHLCDIKDRNKDVGGDPSAKPASPIIGLVPVPQCPPGYQKVIQVTPASISMAQAGQLAESDYPGKAKNSGNHTVDVVDAFNLKEGETIPSDVHANDSNTALSHLGKIKAAFDKVISQRPSQNEANPTYQRNFVIGGEKCKSWKPVGGSGTKICTEYEPYDDVRTTLSPEVSGASTDTRYNTANKVDGVGVTYDDTAVYNYKTLETREKTTAKTDDIKLSDKTLVGKVEKISLRSTVIDDDLANWYNGGGIRDTGTRYILTSTGDALEPMVFQKNTRMYTQAIPLSDGSDIDGVGAPYIRAWELMMGFIYPAATYSKLLSNTEDLMKMSENNLLWNVFPVQYTSLEAFVTTYCYWDSANRLGDVASDVYNTTGELPKVENYYPDSYKPDSGGTLEFRKKLNDPSMKYNELW